MTDLLEKTDTRPTGQEIPHATGWPGRADKLLRPLQLNADPFAFMIGLHQHYGEIVRVKGFPFSFTFAFSPALTRQVLTNPDVFRNGGLENYSIKLPPDSAMARISHTINTVNGPDHRQLRRLMMPAFQRKRVETYAAAMLELIEGRLGQWQTNQGQPRDILREMKQLTMAIAVKTLLGLDPAQDGEAEASRRLIENWVRAGSGLLALVPYDLPGLPLHRTLKLADQIEETLRKIIARKRQQGGEGSDVLSSLIAAHDEDGTRLSDQDLISQTLALFLAGHETTATALTWTLFLLSQHPQIAADLTDELETRLQGRPPTLEELDDLKLLDRVIKESMRVLSPFVLGLRFNDEEVALGPYRLPAHSAVVFSPLMLHHDPAIYDQPRRFWPQRWESIDPSPYEYLPFSSGPRMCVGATFAILEMKLVLATMLQRYRLALVPGSRIDRAGLLLQYPKLGMPMLVYQQDGHFSQNPARGNIHKIVRLQ